MGRYPDLSIDLQVHPIQLLLMSNQGHKQSGTTTASSVSAMLYWGKIIQAAVWSESAGVGIRDRVCSSRVMACSCHGGFWRAHEQHRQGEIPSQMLKRQSDCQTCLFVAYAVTVSIACSAQRLGHTWTFWPCRFEECGRICARGWRLSP